MKEKRALAITPATPLQDEDFPLLFPASLLLSITPASLLLEVFWLSYLIFYFYFYFFICCICKFHVKFCGLLIHLKTRRKK